MGIRSTWQQEALLGLALVLISACTFLAHVPTGEALIGQPACAVQARFASRPSSIPAPLAAHAGYNPTRPYGQYTYAADFDATGKLVSFRQILTTTEFARVRVNTATQKDVLQTVGKPEETAHFPLMRRLVWSHRFRHEGARPSLMNFYFDDTGVVRLTQVSPDPMYDHDQDSNR